ncbi:MAG: hypothetical protein AVDCRST_MAG26-4251, partial [uncultured Chloroflexia bacterium]
CYNRRSAYIPSDAAGYAPPPPGIHMPRSRSIVTSKVKRHMSV